MPTFRNALQKSFIFIFSQNRSTKSNLGIWKGYCNEAWLYMQPPQLEQWQEIAFIRLQTRLSNSISTSSSSHNIDFVAKIWSLTLCQLLMCKGAKFWKYNYHQISNIRHTLIGNKTVDHSNIIEASPVGAAPTTSSFSTQHLTSIDCAETTVRRDDRHLIFVIGISYIRDFTVNWCFVKYSLCVLFVRSWWS